MIYLILYADAFVINIFRIILPKRKVQIRIFAVYAQAIVPSRLIKTVESIMLIYSRRRSRNRVTLRKVNRWDPLATPPAVEQSVGSCMGKSNGNQCFCRIGDSCLRFKEGEIIKINRLINQNIYLFIHRVCYLCFSIKII